MSRIGFVLALSFPLLLAACGEPPAKPAPTPSTPGPASETDRAIREALRTKRVVALEWNEATLDDAVAYLRTITGLNFFVTPRVRSEKAALRLTLKVADAPAADALDLLTSRNGLKWEVRDGLVRIALADER